VLPLPNHENRDERGAHVKQYTSELLSLQAQDGPGHSGTQPEVLWSVLNRYVRTDTGNTGGLTLLLLHANGLHKEVSVRALPLLDFVLNILDV
jgi:hypothetical protein